MNRIQIFGNLTRDVEIGEKGETRYAKFTIASDRSSASDSNTDYFPVVAFGDMAADLADLRKGVFVKVAGTCRLGKYNERLTVEVVAKRVERKAPAEERPA